MKGHLPLNIQKTLSQREFEANSEYMIFHLKPCFCSCMYFEIMTNKIHLQQILLKNRPSDTLKCLPCFNHIMLIVTQNKGNLSGCKASYVFNKQTQKEIVTSYTGAIQPPTNTGRSFFSIQHYYLLCQLNLQGIYHLFIASYNTKHIPEP